MAQEKIFLTAEWKHLAMLNYEIEPSVLRPMVPSHTELDAWNGKTFVSLVGFMFLKTRVLGLPIPFHQNFEEVNLRFYVRHKSGGEWRRGVVFIKEIVPRWAIATVARVVYNENYASMPMRHSLEVEAGTVQRDGAVEYGWHYQGEWNHLRTVTQGAAQRLVAGSEEEFITEHYWGYAAQKNGGCMEYQVEHPSWRVWQVSESSLRCNVAALYGEKYAEALAGKACSAFVAEGSPIVVRKGVKL
jgi:uncharacterized protein YqjF (DUF2071 family)